MRRNFLLRLFIQGHSVCFAFLIPSPLSSPSQEYNSSLLKKQNFQLKDKERDQDINSVVDPLKQNENREILQDASLENVQSLKTSNKNNEDSKREMLSFALPALGIFLSSPLLSNIDNAFVGKTVGTAGLAALSPGTICTDQMLYLFSFLSRATTGIVARAYTKKGHDKDSSDDSRIAAAREAASTPLTVAIISGLCLSIFYALFTPHMLKALNVDPILRPAASSYITWRGSIAWAALAQSVSLSIMLATRDAVSPLKIIGLAAIVNVIGDSLLCVYPLRLGCPGAAAATAFATVFSSAFMLRDLAKKKLLPEISLPKLDQLKELFGYVGPLFIITIARLTGFISMQRAAMRCGVKPLAAYQICVNCLIFFLLFGEPLSQLHQTKLPALLDDNDKEATLITMKSVLTLALYASVGVGTVSFAALTLGNGFFTSDMAVREIIRNTAPSVCIAVMTAIMTVCIDGAMLAARDFSFIILLGLITCVMQLYLSSKCTTLTGIFLAFALRLGTYSFATIVRVASGHGALGKVLMNRKKVIDPNDIGTPAIEST